MLEPVRPGEAAIPLDLEVFDRSGLFGVVVHAVHHLNKPRLRKISSAAEAWHLLGEGASTRLGPYVQRVKGHGHPCGPFGISDALSAKNRAGLPPAPEFETGQGGLCPTPVQPGR